VSLGPARPVKPTPEANTTGSNPESCLTLGTAELFITAGAIVAERAARGRADRFKVEQIIRRAVDQATAARGVAA
jgi:hypothetical protein